MMSKRSAIPLLALIAVHISHAFVMTTPPCLAPKSVRLAPASTPVTSHQKPNRSTSTSSALHASSHPLASSSEQRRAFIVSVAGSALATAAAAWPPSRALADDVDDLAMPSPDDERAQQEAEMQARIKKKMELQKKASKGVSYTQSFKNEQEKQTEMKKSKEEMRNAMCEELGRGC